MTPSRSITLLSVGLGFALSLAIIVLGIFSIAIAGPQIEAHLFPIVTATNIADSPRRTDTGMCWGTHLVKHRAGTPLYFVYIITHKLGKEEEVIPVLAYRIDENGVKHYLSRKGAVVVHDAGVTWDDEYCFDTPSDFSTFEPFTVSGEVEYEVSHHLWRVPAPMPPFTVTSLSKLKR